MGCLSRERFDAGTAKALCVSHKRLVSTRRGGESERIPEYKNQSVARTVASVSRCGLREPRVSY